MTKINSYADLCREYPWLDGMLKKKSTRAEAAFMIYQHGGCDEIRRVADNLGIKKDIEAFMDEEVAGNA